MQFTRFAAVGVIGTFGHYLVLVALVHLSGADPVLASGAGSLVGAAINYFLNYSFTFNSNEKHRIALPKFLIVMLAGFIINLVMMYITVNILGIYYLVAQVISTGAVLVWNFCGNRFWTFGNDAFARRAAEYAGPHAALGAPGSSEQRKGFRSWLSRLT